MKMLIVAIVLTACTWEIQAELPTLSDRAGTSAATLNPSITFQTSSVAISGMTPGGKVILFGIGRRPLGVAAVSYKLGLIQTGDGTGSTTFLFDRPLETSSVYAAIDLETGAHVIMTPGTYPLRLTTLPPKAFHKVGETYAEVALARVNLDILCVRPKKAAWRTFLTDGSSNDRDSKANGAITVDPTAFQPLEPTKEQFKDFKEHDLVILIDALEMDVMVAEVQR
ncbi:MAG: hypothetical protein QOE68_1873 [Thermoanaerobaculia bacterium]|jgi:hypothetical protein|nr:hypothetical protein [Thermoanaerobaculia bacterium]